MMDFKIGFGYDVHRLEKGYKLIIGGIDIPFEKGAVGHSDADVLIHAICDALLGAAAMGDIGLHFPDTDVKYKDMDSAVLLHKVVDLLAIKNFEVGNIDTTICLQSPKLSGYIMTMRENLSDILSLDINDISIKATTTEKLGFVGEGKGISAYAVALIKTP